MPPDSSAEAPWPVRRVSQGLSQWIGRMGWVWVEGQLTQCVRRPGTRTAFLTLRDTAADMSLQVTCPVDLLDSVSPPLREGAQVVVHARPSFWPARGSLSLAADDLRPVGIGALLARLEELKRVLAAEGLFDPRRKKPLPFLPHSVGLVCGRASAAERDVVENARRRWPAVQFEVREVAVQGPSAVPEVVEALRALDRDRSVDVIVLARGGGAVEDLLAFSNEALVRAVAECLTPVVSAIGHEVDSPLVDLAADVRASTPTDAAKLVVPDLAEEVARLAALRQRASAAVAGRVAREQAQLDALRSRPLLADPHRLVEGHEQALADLRTRTKRSLLHRLDRAQDEIAHALARTQALSPLATLERGYAVVQRRDDGAVVRDPADAVPGTSLRIRVAAGELGAEVADVTAPRTGGTASEV
nr:exodeoxyribonuclease VII large subunit [Motilibacter peucedani]